MKMSEKSIDQEMFLQRIKECCDGENGRPKNIVELAERVNLAKHSIYKWNAQKPTYDKVAEVAEELNVTTDYLINGV